MPKITAVNLIELIMTILMLGLVILHFVPYLIVGGVVVDQKIETGYMIRLRQSPNVWQETNALLYYAHLLQPWIAFPSVFCVVCLNFFRSYLIKKT